MLRPSPKRHQRPPILLEGRQPVTDALFRTRNSRADCAAKLLKNAAILRTRGSEVLVDDIRIGFHRIPPTAFAIQSGARYDGTDSGASQAFVLVAQLLLKVLPRRIRRWIVEGFLYRSDRLVELGELLALTSVLAQ